LQSLQSTEVTAVIAIDGGYTETFVREEFPSASIVFFTFGPLFFKLSDLRSLDHQRFIAPEDLRKLKQLQRFSLVLPTRGICRKDQPTLTATIRATIFDFFERDVDENETLMDSLRWFLFRRWADQPDDARTEEIARCPWPRNLVSRGGATLQYVRQRPHSRRLGQQACFPRRPSQPADLDQLRAREVEQVKPASTPVRSAPAPSPRQESGEHTPLGVWPAVTVVWLLKHVFALSTMSRFVPGAADR
jgi:hypothetical protein